jgi:hypothetical protein
MSFEFLMRGCCVVVMMWPEADDVLCYASDA